MKRLFFSLMIVLTCLGCEYEQRELIQGKFKFSELKSNQQDWMPYPHEMFWTFGNGQILSESSPLEEIFEYEQNGDRLDIFYLDGELNCNCLIIEYDTNVLEIEREGVRFLLVRAFEDL